METLLCSTNYNNHCHSGAIMKNLNYYLPTNPPYDHNKISDLDKISNRFAYEMYYSSCNNKWDI